MVHYGPRASGAVQSGRDRSPSVNPCRPARIHRRSAEAQGRLSPTMVRWALETNHGEPAAPSLRCAVRGTRGLLSRRIYFFVPVMRSKTGLALVRFFGAALLLVFTALAQTAAPWLEADRLFHSGPHWLGADAAFSVDLGRGRVLWLFGDSFVASKLGQTRRQSRMARNTAAIQTGYDPSTASIKFYWRAQGSGSFVPDH